MTIRPLVRYPDSRLAMPARAVTAFDDGLRAVAAELCAPLARRDRARRK